MAKWDVGNFGLDPSGGKITNSPCAEHSLSKGQLHRTLKCPYLNIDRLGNKTAKLSSIIEREEPDFNFCYHGCTLHHDSKPVFSISAN